jgi:hypothetical protein
MREISAKVVGSVVLVLGAVVALAAGVLLPILGGGGGFAGPAAGSAVSSGEETVTSKAATSSQSSSRSPVTQSTRLRKPSLAGALAAAAKMPASADMVLVIDNAADLRGSPVGDATVRFLIEASGMAQTREAWSTLAAQLGWSETETFDRLLGKRVVLVARGFGDADKARWALLSDIAIETDTRLKEKLEASQRAIDKGHQILTLEKGKYELTSHRRRRSAKELAAPDVVSAAPEVSGDDVTIVLGPAGRSELFDEMVGVLASGSTEMLAGHDVITAAGSAGASEVLLIARLGEADKPVAKPGIKSAPADPTTDRWADFFVLAGGRASVSGRPVPLSAAGKSIDPSEFTSRVIYRDRSRRDANLAIAPTSDAAFRALVPGSLLTIVQAAPVQQVLGDAARLLDALRDLPLPEPAQQYLDARQVLSLREVATPDEVRSAQVAAMGKSTTHIAGVLALETKSTAKLAPLLDASITRFIAAREQQFGVTRPPPHDFGGRLPGVTRVLPLDLPDGNPLRIFVADPLTLAWSYPASAPQAQRSVHPADHQPGWWIMSITPTPPGLESLPEQAHNAVAAALSEPTSEASGAAEARWIWLGYMRAADLERRLPGTGLVPDIGGFRSAMKRLEHLRIELSINASGDIQGDLTAKLVQTPTK